MNLPKLTDPTHVASFSEPPLGKTGRAPTWADVAMRLVHDGPMYAVIGLVGVMAIKGQANAQEFVITGLGALLARSFPRAVQVSGSAAVLAFFLGRLLVAPAFASVDHEAEKNARRGEATRVGGAIDWGDAPGAFSVSTNEEQTRP